MRLLLHKLRKIPRKAFLNKEHCRTFHKIQPIRIPLRTRSAMMSIVTSALIGSRITSITKRSIQPSCPLNSSLFGRENQTSFCKKALKNRTPRRTDPNQTKHNLKRLTRSHSKMTKKREKEISLSEKLSSLIQTKPSTIESDDDDLVTAEKFAQNENDSEYSADELDVSKFRRINDGLLEEDDKKYCGKGVSRRDLDSSAESDFTEGEDDDEENEFSSGEENESEQDVEEDGEESGSESEVQSSKGETNDKTKSAKSKSKEENNFNKEIFLKAASDIEKGKAIRNQLQIWDFLLECRMKFQKSLVASNQFPNYKNFPKFKSKESPLFQDSVNDCKKSLKHLLNSLLNLQNTLLKSNEEFLGSQSSEGKDYDEEIPSDTDEDEDVEKGDVVKRLKKLNDFSDEISKRHANFQLYRNNTIQKWNDKTRIGYISNKNFSAFEQSALKQIEHVLLDKQRLIKRTQTKRTNYHILGDDKEPPTKKSAPQPSSDSLATSLDNKSKGLCKEIFDDDDFYHQLLNEMVKRKANDITDPVQLGRQWMQLQKIRSKMKKTVDTKSSKGRKVRFVVHPKLVNFMMPIDNSNYNEEYKTELFNSLFGKTKK